jgi:hypothetical protein
MKTETTTPTSVSISQTSVVMSVMDRVVGAGEEERVLPVMFIKPFGRSELIAAPMCSALESESFTEILERVNVEEYVAVIVGVQIIVDDKDPHASKEVIESIIKKKAQIVKDYVKNTKPEDFDADEIKRLLSEDKSEGDHEFKQRLGVIVVEMFEGKQFAADCIVEEKGGFKFLGEPNYFDSAEEGSEALIMFGRGEDGEKERKNDKLVYGNPHNPTCTDEDIKDLKEALEALGFIMTPSALVEKHGGPIFKYGKEIHENEISGSKSSGKLN